MASLMATQDLLIWLLLVVVKVVILPLCTWALMPGALSMLRSGMLPTNMLGLVNVGRFPPSMLGLVHTGRSHVVPLCIDGEGMAFKNGIVTMVRRQRVARESRRSASARHYFLFLQIKDKRLHRIQTKGLVW